MYWQKYFQLNYSNDTVRWKEAKINVKGTDPLYGNVNFLIPILDPLFMIIFC